MRVDAQDAGFPLYVTAEQIHHLARPAAATQFWGRRLSPQPASGHRIRSPEPGAAAQAESLVKLHAYLLAADPTWLRTAIGAYYDQVERIVVSYDKSSRGWTGAPINVTECLRLIAECDVDHKVELLAGEYRASAGKAMQAETAQRQVALDHAAVGADWVIQLDTDEILPDLNSFIQVLHEADRKGLGAVEWPMRVLYRTLSSGAFLEVAEADGSIHVEYPGPVAVKPGTVLTDARRCERAYLRVTCRSGAGGAQLAGPADELEHRAPLIDIGQIIWHNSWARSPSSIRAKTSSWGHAQGWRTRLYYAARWYPAPLFWPAMRNLHPFAPGLWPRLHRIAEIPIPMHPQDLEPER